MEELILTHTGLIDQNDLDSIVFQLSSDKKADEIHFSIMEFPETDKYGDPNDFVEVKLTPRQFKSLTKMFLRFDESLSDGS